MLAISWDNPETLHAKLRAMEELTRQPFGVNLCLANHTTEQLEWKLSLCSAYRVPVVSLFWGDPAEAMSLIRSMGVVVMVTVGTAEEAQRAISLGVDGVVLQGIEAGGHVWGQAPLLSELAAVVKVAENVPVVAAGGMTTSQQIQEALAMGASGVWLGSRFLCTVESGAHPIYKAQVIQATGADTVVTSLFNGGWPNAPHRVIRNSTYMQWEAAGCPAQPMRPGEGERLVSRPEGGWIERYSSDAPYEGCEGKIEASVLYAGAGIGHITDIPTVAEMMARWF